MGRRKALAVLCFFIAAGCGSTGFLHDEGEALRAGSSPAAAAGFLGLLPAKKEGPRDPGEIVEGEWKRRWGIEAGWFGNGPFPPGEVQYLGSAILRGFLRLGADRARPHGLELGVGYVDMEGADVDTRASDLFLRAQGLFRGGADWFYLSAGMQLVHESVEYMGENTGDHFGATLDLGMHFRIGRHIEYRETYMRFLGSDNAAWMLEMMLGMVF